jgi:hypothetical protein
LELPNYLHSIGHHISSGSNRRLKNKNYMRNFNIPTNTGNKKYGSKYHDAKWEIHAAIPHP